MRENIAEMRERQAYRQEIARLRAAVQQLETELLAHSHGEGPGLLRQ